ncbi:hypothetical protein [Marinivivus vitaminiproducens]|uniref:hypothetical protein n=1 Tax=Marinivivus vitaminiproducens TaxID=3035935 RepID=UPI00279F917A|nr:adenylate kinase [Geminicoccaceae bacterium SCSIO 64248]
MRPRHVHITGASGAGVTTLGRALAKRLGAVHVDTDDAYWLPVEPAYSAKRPVPERLAMIEACLEREDRVVLSGSIMTWGDPLIPWFGAVVFVSTEPAIRMERLRRREFERYGDAILPGGPRHDACAAFLEWASRYEDPAFASRSRARHEAWLGTLSCPVIRVDGGGPPGQVVDATLAALG